MRGIRNAFFCRSFATNNGFPLYMTSACDWRTQLEISSIDHDEASIEHAKGESRLCRSSIGSYALEPSSGPFFAKGLMLHLRVQSSIFWPLRWDYACSL